MRMGAIRAYLLLLGFFLGFFPWAPVQSETYPDKPVRLIVPLSAGSAAEFGDLIRREMPSWRRS